MINGNLADAPDFRLAEVHYLGAGSLPIDDPVALVTAFWKPVKRLPEDSPIRNYLVSLAQNGSWADFLHANLDCANADSPEYELTSLGDCMVPAVPADAKCRLSRSATVEAGQLCAFVYSFGFMPKFALYLGAIDDPPVEGYRDIPRTLYCFFQRDPAVILGVADVDLVEAQAVVAVERDGVFATPELPWDVLAHSDMREMGPMIDPRPLPAPAGMHLSLAAQREAWKFFRQVDTASRNAIQCGTSLEMLKQHVVNRR